MNSRQRIYKNHRHKKTAAAAPGRFFYSNSGSVLGAAFELTGAGVNFDGITNFNESSHRQLVTVVQLGQLHHFTGGVTTDSRFGVRHVTHDGGRQFNADGFAFVEGGFTNVGHAVFDEVQYVTEVFFFHFDRVVLLIHKHIQRVLEVRVSYLATLQNNLVKFVVGLENRLLSGAGQQVFQLHFHY